MNHDRLRLLLLAADGEAVSTFLSLLDDPDVDVRSDADLGLNTTANLLAIYRLRAEHSRRVGQLTLGFGESVERIESTTHERLALVVGTVPSGHPICIAFLAPDLSAVVATLAVLKPAQKA